MNISEKGLAFIKSFEGCKLQVYKDSAGRNTVGWGHLVLPGENFGEGITQEQADDLFLRDVKYKAEIWVNLFAPETNQNEFDALCSFSYNLGEGSLKKMLSHGFENVPNQILFWNHAGGEVVEGLTRRRQAELALFSTPVEPV